MAETIPGGYYLGADGKPHDANGKPLPEMPVAVETPVVNPDEGVTTEAAPVEPEPIKQTGKTKPKK